MSITIIDTTLRDGLQAPHVALGPKDRIAIAAMLADAGVREIEAGTAAIGETERRCIADIVRIFPGNRISVWCRARLSDIFEAAKTGCDTVHISFPLSDLHCMIAGLEADRLNEHLEALFAEAKKLFGRVTVGCLDMSRAPLPRVLAFARRAVELGAARIRLADTVGVMTPLETIRLISAVRNALPGIAIDFHAHNDLGMATANAVTALASGAEAVSVTVNGLGERAGNAALEEVVMALSRSVPRIEHGIDTTALANMCASVALLTHRPIPPAKPVIGELVFTHESGIHCDGMLKDPRSYEPFPPHEAGHAPSSFVAGTHSGKAGLRQMLGEDPGRALDDLLQRVRDDAVAHGRSFSADEVRHLHRSPSAREWQPT